MGGVGVRGWRVWGGRWWGVLGNGGRVDGMRGVGGQGLGCKEDKGVQGGGVGSVARGEGGGRGGWWMWQGSGGGAGDTRPVVSQVRVTRASGVPFHAVSVSCSYASPWSGEAVTATALAASALRCLGVMPIPDLPFWMLCRFGLLLGVS